MLFTPGLKIVLLMQEGGGIGFGVCDDIENAVIEKEIVIDKKDISYRL